MVLIGSAFTGKSTLCLNTMYLKNEQGKPFRVLYIDAEGGSVDDYIKKLIRDGINPNNLHLIYTTSLTEVNEIIKDVTQKKPLYYYNENGTKSDEVVLDADGEVFMPDCVIVDGASILYDVVVQGYREFSKKRNKVKVQKDKEATKLEEVVAVEGADIELRDYNRLKFEGKNFVLNLTASGINYIITAREKAETETSIVKVNGENKQVSVPTGRYIAEGWKDLDFNAKTFARLYRDDETDPIVKMVIYCHPAQ